MGALVLKLRDESESFETILGQQRASMELAIQALGQTRIQKLNSPLQTLIQRSKGITEAISSQNYTKAEKLLNDYDKSEQIYSKQTASLAKQLSLQSGALLKQIKLTASITKDGVRRQIKNIATDVEAAEIYNMMAAELFGDFAAFNEV